MDLINYSQAKRLLKARGIDTTPDEFAQWVAYGDESCDYKHRPSSDDPTRQPGFRSYHKTGERLHIADYFWNRPDVYADSALNPREICVEVIHNAHFDSIDMRSFLPIERYLTYQELSSRWRGDVDEPELAAFLRARANAKELQTHHPLPFIGQALSNFSHFALSEIEAIEIMHFGTVAAPSTLGTAAVATIKDERACESWLTALMKDSSEPTASKNKYLADAKKRFSISERGFTRVWRNAIAASGSIKWSEPGRRKSRP